VLQFINKMEKAKKAPNKKFWLVAVSMGYGHQRTAFPLKGFAKNKSVVNANNYPGIPEKDKKIWESTRSFYEFISRFKRVPLIGELAFSIFNKFQQIPAYYPRRDLSRPTLSLKKVFSLIKKGWGRDLIEKLKKENKQIKENLPLITTFFIPAFMAESFGYDGEIFCIICDADISRSWVSLYPKESRIKYFAPNSWVVNRLKLYGAKQENIFLTGYPLPIENIGEKDSFEILKEDLKNRLLNLDPEKRYFSRYGFLIKEKLGEMPESSDHILTILFSIGGAGAQKEIAIGFIKSLSEKIKREKIRIILSAGIRKEVRDYFLKQIRFLGLENNLNKNIEILFEKEIGEYFQKFNQKLRKTDILWTKPSELSFYSGLGIPIIIAPSIGSQEDFNKKWLLSLGAGILQENPAYADQWIFDYLKSGRFAEAAIQGFIEVEKMGVYNIQEIIKKK